MTSEENPIISENYADLLIAYHGDYSAFEAYPNAPVNIINDIAAVVHIPVQDITDRSILELGYATVPSLFGPVSDSGTEASGISRVRKLPEFDLKGQGVLIGLIDTGIDYTNPVFQYDNKTTRIVSIWDQSDQGGKPPAGRKFGTEYTGEQINLALQSSDPFQVVASRDENGHGTMIAGIAGGNPVPKSGFYGAAPGVEFVAVKLKQAKKVIRDFFLIPDKADCYQETDILYAIEYVLSTAAYLQRPVVLCVAVSTSQSAHDGRGLTSSYLSSISTRSGIGVVVAAGNEGNSRRHYFGIVDPVVGYNTVELNIGEEEKGFSMELWGESPSIFTVDILTPEGEYIQKIVTSGNAFHQITFQTIPTVINIDFRITESESGDQLILMRFINPTTGVWRFNVYESGDLSSGFHIWLPMEGFISDGTYFLLPDPYTTILAMGNAKLPVTVTAYNHADDNLYINSSKGYNRLGDVKPNVAAPGVNITGPTLQHGFTGFTGTSIAAAHTSGAVAMILEWGIVNNNYAGMSTVEINRLLMRNARRVMGEDYPNRDWGFGILDLFNVFESLQHGAI